MHSRQSWTIRWWWIIATYLTNKPFWVVLIITAVWLVGAAIMAWSPSRTYVPNYPPSPRGSVVVNSKDSLEFVRRAGRQAEVDAIYLDSLWYSLERAHLESRKKGTGQGFVLGPPPESFYDILDEFPNLSIVQVRFWDARAGVSQIARLQHLKYLSIFSTEFHDLTPLRTLNELERIDLQVFHPPTGLDSLSNLPNLDTVIVQSDAAVTPDVLSALAQLPHLRTLGLAFSSSFVARERITVQSLSVLRDSAELETIYVGGEQSPLDLELLRNVRAAIPHLSVYPALVTRRVPLIAYAFPCILMGLGVGFVLANQFYCSAVGLAPDFARRNATVAAAWISAVGLAVSICLWMAGFHPGAAALLTLALGSTSISVFVNQFHSQRSNSDPNSVGQWLIGLGVAALFLLLALPAAGDAFRASNPWMLLALAAVIPLALFPCARTLRNLGNSDAMARPPRGNVGQVPFRRGWMFATEEREQRIETWPSAAEYWNWWNRVQRWRCGNPPFRAFRFLLLCSLLGIPGIAIWSQMLPQIPLDAWRGQLVMMPFFLLGAATLRIAQDWSNRMRSLGAESLHPYFLRALQREWAAAILVDLVPIVLLLGIVEALALNLAVATHTGPHVAGVTVDWARVPFDFTIITMAGLPICAGLAAMLIVIERAWVRIAAVFVVFVVTFVATGLVVASREGLSPNINLHAVVPQLWLPALLGALLAYWMWRRWLAMELDRRT